MSDKQFCLALTGGSRRRGWLAAVGTLCLASMLSGTAAAESTGNPPPALSPSLVYDGDGFANVRGGLRRAGTYSGNLNLRLFVDGNAALGWPGTLAYVDALWVHGGQPSNIVGDAQGVSNISASGVTEIYEAWLQKNAFGNRLSVLGGLYDMNVEFYNLQAASLFVNSSFGIGPEFSGSGVEGPSIFPKTAFGLRLAVKPSDATVIRLGVVNGVPFERPDGSHAIRKAGDGALIVVEGALLDRPEKAERPQNRRFQIGRHESASSYDDKIAVGGWHYTSTFDDLVDLQADGTPIRRHGSSGYYAVGQALLYGSKARRVSAFAQAGVGDARTGRFGSYVGTGVTASGLPGVAADDELGLAVAVARNGSHYIASQRLNSLRTTASETAIELTFLHVISPHLYVQPDLQYVVHPNTDPRIRNALALQLRFEVAY
ncbi:MAG: carbohydrate porin [Pseudomonadota bacterium]|nr:carbohydrate porin [Pseudomonadota bacterium]